MSDRRAVVTLDSGEAYRIWAPRYEPRAHTPLMRVEERAVLTLLPDLAGRRVVDVGCGTGRYLEIARRRHAATLIGVDASRAMLDHVCCAGVRLVQGRVEALPIAAAQADVTICALTLGHVGDLVRAFVELARITCPGGILVCSELHPQGAALGWRRTFETDGCRYAVREAGHPRDEWWHAARAAGWRMDACLEPRLQTADVPEGVAVDPVVLDVPCALVLRLVRGNVRPMERCR
ncbi:MAG TPA: class I SAM-dependent methyltransferase [Vicinamibacterales bacterium]